MVVLHPTKDQAWRWQTSNSEYGKFYVSIHREVLKKQEAHKDCSKKYEALGKELSDCKLQLERMKLTCGRNPCLPEGGSPRCTLRPTSPKLGNCECPSRPGPPNPDMYVSETMNEFNGGKRHDPQFLVDHIKANHPRLVKRLQPKLPPMSLNRGAGDHFPKENECGRGGYDSGGDDAQRPGSSGAGGAGRCKRKMVGTYKQDENASCKQRTFFCGDGSRPASAGAVNLSPSQRYNFYRYYGYAGQGAKTSKGWHSKK